MKRKMKNILFIFLVIFVPGMFLSSIAYAAEEPSYDLSLASFTNNMYIGFDAGFKNTSTKSGHGHGLFKGTHKMGRYILATKLTPNIDAEVYMEGNVASNKKASGGGQGRAKFTNAGLGIIYKFDVSNTNNIKPFIGIGFKHVKVKLDHNRIADLDLTHAKMVGKVNAGLEFMLNNNVGARVLTSFENTSRLKPTINGKTTRFGNSFGMSTMLFAKIC